MSTSLLERKWSGHLAGRAEDACLFEQADDRAISRKPCARGRELFELLGHRLCALESVCRGLFDRAHHDPFKGDRDVRRAAVQRNRRVAPNPVRCRTAIGAVTPLEWASATNELVEHDAQREQVAARIDGFAQDLLG